MLLKGPSHIVAPSFLQKTRIEKPFAEVVVELRGAQEAVNGVGDLVITKLLENVACTSQEHSLGMRDERIVGGVDDSKQHFVFNDPRHQLPPTKMIEHKLGFRPPRSARGQVVGGCAQ